MREVQGKLVFESLEEVVDPKHTALVIIDMQNGLASLEGYAARHAGMSVAHQRAVIAPIQRLLNTARNAGARVVHVQVVFDEDQASTSPAWIYQGQRYQRQAGSRVQDFATYWGHPGSNNRKPTHEVLIDGTWEGEIIPELAPQPGDFVVKKHRNSAFVNTPMDQLLRSNGVQSVVITGTSTAGCVLATALDAQWYDYYTVVVQDCVADGFPERHQAGMSLLKERFDMPTADEVIALWAKKRVGVRV